MNYPPTPAKDVRPGDRIMLPPPFGLTTVRHFEDSSGYINLSLDVWLHPDDLLEVEVFAARDPLVEEDHAQLRRERDGE